MEQKPTENKGSRIGRLGEEHFSSHKPINWIVNKQSEYDFGYDYWIHLEDSIHKNIKTGFLAQLKTQAKARIKDGYILLPIEAKNLNYYNHTVCPLMIICCDLQGYDDASNYLDRNNITYYYDWYENIVTDRQNLVIKIPITNKLTQKINIDNELEQFISEFQAFRVSKKNNNNKSLPKIFKDEEIFSNNSCRISTPHVTLTALIPTIKKIDYASCCIHFAIQGTEDCLMAFNHKTILYDLFCGALNQSSFLNRKFIVNPKWDDENSLYVQLGNCRYLLKKEYLSELCSVIDRLFYQYIASLRQIDDAFKLSNFIYDQNHQGFKLVTVPLIVWHEILLIADEFSHDKGKSDWHIFYKNNNSSISLEQADEQNQIKFFAKLKAVREHNNRMFDSNENVLIVWKYPKYELNHPYKNNNCIWDLETCYTWLVETLLPFAIQHGKERFSLKSRRSFYFIRKKANSSFHYMDKEGFFHFSRDYKSEQLIEYTTIHDHNTLKILICQIHDFFSDYASSSQLKIDYSPQQSADFTEALILSFEHTNNYHVHDLNSTFFFNEGTFYQNKEEFIRALENSKNDILNKGWLEFKLRAFKALLEDSNLPMPTSIVTKILKKLSGYTLLLKIFY